MAEKISTIILKVDLDCRRCYKKISKAICKLQERENIQTVAFDEKNNTVAISGPFDPKKLIKKLCCKAGDVIKDIQIKEEKDKPKPKDDKPKDDKPKPKDDKPKDDKPKPKDDKPKDDKPKPKDDKPKDDKPKDDKPKPKDDKPKDDKPKPKDDKPKDDKPKDDKPKDDKPKDDKPKDGKPGDQRPLPGPGCSCGCHLWPDPGCSCGRPWPGPECSCGCRPWYYGDYKCPWCGRGYGWVPADLPPPVYVYGAPYGGYKTCHIICEEDPQSSCSVM